MITEKDQAIAQRAMQRIRAEQGRTQNIGDYGKLEAIILATIEEAKAIGPLSPAGIVQDASAAY